MIDRTIFTKIKEAIKTYPVTVVTGARQVGKSTEVYKFAKDGSFKYVSLDNIDERRLAINDPRYFIEVHGYPLIIDEVQYAPVLMEVIEEIVNRRRLENKQANGLFILTGSQAFKLMKGVSQSMAGRAAILHMEPLSFCEIAKKEERPFVPSKQMLYSSLKSLSVSELYKQIIKGFYPEIYNNPSLDSETFYSRYVSTYVDRDLNDILEVRNKSKFHDFMAVLASLTSQQLNLSTISRAIGVSVPTIREWLSVLEASGLIYFLRSYSETSMLKRITKAPKIYFADTGLCAYLLHISDPATLEKSIFAGAFMETYVMNEIRKSYLNNDKAFNGSYYRDNNQNEIDLILLKNAKLHLIEIKKGSSFNLSDVKSFKQLDASMYEVGQSCIISNTQRNYALSSNIHVLSASCIGE